MQPDDRPLPALWGYANKVYIAMRSTAKADGEGNYLYEGHLTQLFRELEIPNPYYTSVTRTLKSMGCIIQLRRGGGPTASRWTLVGPPEEKAFRTLRDSNKTVRRHAGRLAPLEQQIRDLAAMVKKLEKRVLLLEDVATEVTNGQG